MRKRLSKKEVTMIQRFADRITELRNKVEDNDVQLHYDNGLVSEQLSCAVAALDTILQEYD